MVNILTIPPPPQSTLFPYTTLFRSERQSALAIVSPGSGEGRSWIAANLAVLFAQTGKRTLLIDADLRRPRQHALDRKSTRLNSSHSQISYAVFCLKKKKQTVNLDVA